MNTRGGHIGVLEGVILLYASLIAKVFLQYPAFLMEVGGPAGWQVALVMMVCALVLFLPSVALARRFPGLGLGEIGLQVTGTVIGTLLTLTICAWLMAVTCLTLRNVTENFIIAMLPGTPPSVLSAVMVICAAYASYRGFEALARAAQIVFPVVLVGLLVMLIFTLPQAETGRLFPFWGYGLPRTTLGGFFYTGMVGEAITLLVLGASFRTSDALARSGLIGILLFGLTSTVVVMILAMVFGAPDAAQQPYPMFTLTRLIHLGRFLQRTESLIVMFWFFAAAVRIATLFHAAAVGIADSLDLPAYRPLVFPLAVLLLSLSLIPRDLLVVVELERQWVRDTGIAILLIPLVLLIVAVVRRKGGTFDAS